MKLNPDFEIKVRDSEAGQLLLKNRRNEIIVTMSEIEYDMISIFTENDDVMDIIDKYGSDYDIDYDFIKALIGHGVRLKILVEDDFVSKESVTLMKLRMVVGKIMQLLGLLKLGFRVEFTGGYKLFKLISIDLKGKLVERFLSKSKGQWGAIIFFLLLLVVGGSIFFYNVGSGFKWGYDANLPVVLMVIFVFAGVLFLSFLHELGHYIVYKKFGGKSNEMGVATSNLILPIFYTSTYTMHFWKSRKSKILVTLSGVVMDFCLLFIMFDINMLSQNEAVKYYSLIFAFFMVVRLVGNLNPLIPGTDAYFIIVDAFNLQPWLIRINNNFIEMVRNFKDKKLRGFKTIRRRHLGSVLYALITFVMISVYWLFIIYLILMALISL
ncbi:MAG: hypothetical protein ACEPOW_05835 [Bacteroidales bacterium]